MSATSYYIIATMPMDNRDYCFLEDTPEGTKAIDYKMATGEPMGADYPADPRIYMSDDHPGVKLPDLIGNTCNLLIVSRRIKDGIETATPGLQIEYLPVAIYNHKGRLASRHYFIVNPIGTFDCLDLARSTIEWSGKDIVEIEEYVLDPKKIDKAPDLFRIKEDPETYVMSKRLVKVLVPLAPTNFLVDELKQ